MPSADSLNVRAFVRERMRAGPLVRRLTLLGCQLRHATTIAGDDVKVEVLDPDE